MKYHFPMIATLILVALGYMGCAEHTASRQSKNVAKTDTVVKKSNQNAPTVIGTDIIPLANDVVGDYMDQQQGEIERGFSQGQKSYGLDLQRLEQDVIQLSLSSETFSTVFSSEIQKQFQEILAKTSLIIGKFDKTAVHVIGHTDNTGTIQYNQLLSQRRAKTVGKLLESHGVGNNRIRIEGRGENNPLTSNETAESRRLNRRVEIFLKPIVEGNVEWAFTSPKYY